MTTETFYNPLIVDILSIYSSIIGGITIAIAPIHFYIILTQSKVLGRFKWFIINHSFWCFLFTLSLVITKPVLLLSAASGFLAGVFRETSSQITAIVLFIVLSLAIMSIGGICMTLAYRYFGLFPGRIADACQSIWMIIFLLGVHIFFIVLLILFGIRATSVPQEVMIQQALNYNIGLEPFTKEKTFLFVHEEIHGIPDIFVMTMISIIILTFLVLVYLLYRELPSLMKVEVQRALVISIMVQALVTVMFELLPFTFLFACIKFKISNSGSTMEIFEMFAVTHTLMEYCITLYFVLPYRRFIRRQISGFGRMFKKSPQENTTRVSHNSKIFPICKNNQVAVFSDKAVRNTYYARNWTFVIVIFDVWNEVVYFSFKSKCFIKL